MASGRNVVVEPTADAKPDWAQHNITAVSVAWQLPQHEILLFLDSLLYSQQSPSYHIVTFLSTRS